MSSARFPGKVLMPFLGKPLIANLIAGLSMHGMRYQIVVLTSVEPSDDPLVDFVREHCGVSVFRGDLRDVAGRFQSALKCHPCDWFVRISADSPLMDGGLVGRMINFIEPDLDLVTNVRRRTFPPGQSVECVRSAAFAALDTQILDEAQREHVTPVFYEQPGWRVRSIVCLEPAWANTRMVVDTPDDMREVENLVRFGGVRDVSFASLCEVEAA